VRLDDNCPAVAASRVLVAFGLLAKRLTQTVETHTADDMLKHIDDRLFLIDVCFAAVFRVEPRLHSFNFRKTGATKNEGDSLIRRSAIPLVSTHRSIWSGGTVPIYWDAPPHAEVAELADAPA